MNALSTDSLTHTFHMPRGPVEALCGVTLSVERGEFFGLFGPNGAGKSTLIRCLTTLIIPTGGQATVMGFDVLSQADKVRQNIGLVFANENSFYGRLTGRQNLEFFAALYGLSRAASRRRIEELLALFGIGSPDRQYQECSAGAKQRLLLARALLHDPPVLLLDEPAKSLDPLQIARLHALLQGELQRRQGKTILFTTHQVEEAAQLAGRAAILHRGTIRACGTIQEIAIGGDLRTAMQRMCA